VLGLSHKEGFSVENTVEVDFNIFAKSGRKLIKAANQSITEAGTWLCWWKRVELVLGTIVSVETVDRACNSVFKSGVFKCTNSQIENIALNFTIVTYWITISELDW